MGLNEVLLAGVVVGGGYLLYEHEQNLTSPSNSGTAETPSGTTETGTTETQTPSGPSKLSVLQTLGETIGIVAGIEILKSRLERKPVDPRTDVEKERNVKRVDDPVERKPVGPRETPHTTEEENRLRGAESKARAEAKALEESRKLKEAEEIAKASRIARNSEKATKLAKLSKLAKGTPWGLIFTAVTMTLSATLDLDPEDFNPCDSGEFDMNSLPTWAQLIIGQVPILGDLFSMMGGLICASNKCGDGLEPSAGLCYTPCKSEFKSDGAMICWKQYTGFPSGTITSVTKKITPNTGKPVSTCNGDQDKDGALCYPKCPAGMHGVGPVCWADTTNVGSGTAVQLESCPAGWNNDGLTCREPMHWDGCCSRFLGGCVGCLRGGAVRGRLNNGGTCPAGKERIDGLCYSGCPAGQSHVAGMPYLCKANVPLSQGRGVGTPMHCKDGEKGIAGLCYDPCEAGSTMQSLGLCSQNCPAGTTDFGVGCTRESYNRGVGTPAIRMHLKSRRIFRNVFKRTEDAYNSTKEMGSAIGNELKNL
jgi:hypothetical protein